MPKQGHYKNQPRNSCSHLLLLSFLSLELVLVRKRQEIGHGTAEHVTLPLTSVTTCPSPPINLIGTSMPQYPVIVTALGEIAQIGTSDVP
jgi:hypothetical protein